MKTNAYTYAAVALGLSLTLAILSVVTANYGVDAILGWATAGVLLAMAPLTYRVGGRSWSVR